MPSIATKKYKPCAGDVRKLRRQCQRMHALQTRIGKLRDQYRDVAGDFAEVLETLEHGCNDLDEGLRSLEDGLDAISQTL